MIDINIRPTVSITHKGFNYLKCIVFKDGIQTVELDLQGEEDAIRNKD